MYSIYIQCVVTPRLLVLTRIANLTRITGKMPTTKNSVVLVVDCTNKLNLKIPNVGVLGSYTPRYEF